MVTKQIHVSMDDTKHNVPTSHTTSPSASHTQYSTPPEMMHIRLFIAGHTHQVLTNRHSIAGPISTKITTKQIPTREPDKHVSTSTPPFCHKFNKEAYKNINQEL
jgi:2',3'-cyclic-nucleotide 2'-phosphodiesterase (5'-nucleotidase family)